MPRAGLTKVPLDSPEFLELKARSAEDPGSVELKERIRQLDLALRKEYFREQQFTSRGVFLLLGGVAATLILAKWAATLRRTLPTPVLKMPGLDSDERLSRAGLWAVGVVVLALVGTTWALHVGYPSLLPANIEALASLRADEKERGGTADAGMRARFKPDQIPLPADDQWRRSWPRFRGPDGSGVSAHADVPTAWDVVSGEGLLWKTPVPIAGANSPIVWNGKVFLSGATDQRRAVVCFDTADGKILWQEQVTADSPTRADPIEVSDDTGYAAPTMATDGRFVFAMFANGDLVALDFDGNEVWRKLLGAPKNSYGHAASLAVYKGWVIVQFDQGAAKDGLSKLLAFDGATGRPIWHVQRDMPNSWSSPIVIQHDGQWQIVTQGSPWVIGYAAASGIEIWRAKCMRADVGPSPVYADGMLYVANEFPAMSAIRMGGEGDVTESHIEWQVDVRRARYVQPAGHRPVRPGNGVLRHANLLR